jgi:hypothetical protein
MLIRFSPMKLDPKMAVEADIFCWEDGKPSRGPTWPRVDGVAIILCPDCGEIDEDGRFFERNTVYSNRAALEITIRTAPTHAATCANLLAICL